MAGCKTRAHNYVRFPSRKHTHTQWCFLSAHVMYQHVAPHHTNDQQHYNPAGLQAWSSQHNTSIPARASSRLCTSHLALLEQLDCKRAPHVQPHQGNGQQGLCEGVCRGRQHSSCHGGAHDHVAP